MKRSQRSIGAVVACVLGVAAVGTAMLVLAGCNTVKGAGQDLQEASENTQRAIENATDGN